MNYSPNYKLLFFSDRTCRFINYFILKSATMLRVVTCYNNPTHVYDSRFFFHIDLFDFIKYEKQKYQL